MKRLRLFLALGAAAVGVLLTTQWGLRAQDEKSTKAEPAAAKHAANSTAGISVQEALQRPFIMPFGQPTTLNDVCRHLRMMLKAPVVLDLAALERAEVTAEDTVQLDLHDGVRLKTGLKLLLDQVGLTYRVVPEDNLLIVTDRVGSEDPLDRIESQIKALHRDLHDVQDSLDDLRVALGVDAEDGMKVRKPTIIEEMPDLEAPKDQDKEQEKPKKKSDGPAGASSTRSRPGI